MGVYKFLLICCTCWITGVFGENALFEDLEDSSFSASSSIASATPAMSRLSGTSWLQQEDDVGSYIQVDLGIQRTLAKVATAGGVGTGAYVIDYRIQFSLTNDESTFAWLLDSEGSQITFDGNTDDVNVVTNDFSPYLTAQMVRLRPGQNQIARRMRWELYEAEIETTLSPQDDTTESSGGSCQSERARHNCAGGFPGFVCRVNFLIARGNN